MMTKIQTRFDSAKKMLAAKKAEGYVDTGVKVIIAVVIGALVIALLVALWKNVVNTKVTDSVTELFASQV